ncbi:MAG: hypothetical protein ACK5W1_05405 [Flavobacteriales bacterium]
MCFYIFYFYPTYQNAMPQTDDQISTQLLMEVLGANTFDISSFLGVSPSAVNGYSTGQFKLDKPRRARLNDLNGILTAAHESLPAETEQVLPAEMEALNITRLRTSRLAYRLEMSIARSKDHRAYALRTMELIAAMEARIGDRPQDDPVAQLIRIAKARNSKRLRNHSLPKILAMEARLAGLRAGLEMMDEILG